MFCYNCGNTILPEHIFCVSCGKRIDLSFLQKPSPQYIGANPDFNDLFYKIEATLKRESSLSQEEFEKYWGRFKTDYDYKKYSDKEIYWRIVQVIFYSGMKAAIVIAKLPAIKKYLYDYKIVKDYSKIQFDNILADNDIIRNEKKIKACIVNAKIFNDIILNYGSFASYLESFGNLNEKPTLENIKNEFQQFHFLGKITAYHFMLELGLKVWKPDRVIRRMLFRLGLIKDVDNIEQAVEIGNLITDQVGEPIRYIDIVFVKYGQQGEEEGFGLKGICLEKNP
jgi:DNA-3-methyladenine glycosylase I